eukprot:495312_1
MSAQLLVWAVQIVSLIAISCDHQNCWSISGLESKMSDGSYRSLDGNYMLQGCYNDKAYYLASNGYYLYWSAQHTNWHLYTSLLEHGSTAYCPENSLLLCSQNRAWNAIGDGSNWVDATGANNVVCATPDPSYHPTIHPSIYPTMNPSNNPTNNPSNTPSITPTNLPTTAPTFVPTELPSYSPTEHPATNPTKFLVAANDDYESTLMTTQLVTHNRRSITIESTMGLVEDTNHDAMQWTEEQIMALYVTFSVVILLLVCNIIFFCCCFKRKKHQLERNDTNTMVTIQMGNKHETHQIGTCDVDSECEMVNSWMRNTVQLPQYVHLFISQGYSTMQAIRHIECKGDLAALGIQRGVHQALILTEIKKLQGTDVVVKGGTHGRDVVTMDDGQGHATKSGVLRLPRAPATSTGCITSNDSDSDDSLYVSVKGTQKQKHRRDYLTQLTAEGE